MSVLGVSDSSHTLNGLGTLGCSICKLTNTPDSDIECLSHGVFSGPRDLSRICEREAYEGS